MVDLCTSWEIDDLALLTDRQMEKLLDEGWDMNLLPSSREMAESECRARAVQRGA